MCMADRKLFLFEESSRGCAVKSETGVDIGVEVQGRQLQPMEGFRPIILIVLNILDA